MNRPHPRRLSWQESTLGRAFAGLLLAAGAGVWFTFGAALLSLMVDGGPR